MWITTCLRGLPESPPSSNSPLKREENIYEENYICVYVVKRFLKKISKYWKNYIVLTNSKMPTQSQLHIAENTQWNLVGSTKWLLNMVQKKKQKKNLQ